MRDKLTDVFDGLLGHIHVDTAFIKKLTVFKLNWSSKTDDYIDFISSPLIGVYRVRFTSKDETEFFQDILGIEKEDLQSAIDRSGTIPKNFKVASNAFNSVSIYLVNKIITSNLKKEEMELGIREIYSILALKMLGSIFSNFFPFQVDQVLSQSVYQNLSDKYLIKKEGSWDRVLFKMATVLFPNNIHKDRLYDFNASNVIRIINDVNTRLRSVVKNYARAIYILKDSEDKSSKIYSSTLIQDSEDGQTIKDLTLGINRQVDYVRMIIPSPNDFVDDIKVKLISQLSDGVKKEKLAMALYHISLEHPVPKSNEIDYISVSIKQAVSYLQTRGIDNDFNKKILESLKLLKKYFSSSKVKIEDIYKTKSLLSKFVEEGLKNEKGWRTPPYVIAVMLYIYLISIK